MKKSLVGLAVAALFVGSTSSVLAVGLGNIDVMSALGQPLKASVDLLSPNRADKAGLSVRLASPDAYNDVGLAYPHGNKFLFKVDERENGESRIRVTTNQPINDPFVSLLVELTWNSGKLVREYTFLLDPPNYIVSKPAPAVVRTVAPVVRFTPPIKSQNVPQPVSAARIRSMAESTGSQMKKEPAWLAPVQMVEGIITVKRGDTLSKIAARNKIDGVSLDRMLVALYQANVDKFGDGNMNRIRAGEQLRLPDQDELVLISQTDAEKEIRVQAADWHAYRQKLASAATTGREQADSQQVVSGKITSSVEDKTVVAHNVAKEVLKLSKGAAVGDQVATDASLSAQEKNNAAQEELIAENKTVKDGQSRAALLAKNLQDMKELAQLKSEVAAIAKLENAKSAPVTAPVAKVDPTPVAQPAPVVESEGNSSNMLYFAGIAALLLGLVGWFLWNRRRQDDVESEFEAGEVIVETAVSPTAETPDFANTIVSDTAAVAMTEESGDVDPIAEADLFLSFGRDAQAEEILKQALSGAPQNHQLHLKLLDIYAKRNDVAAFADTAQKLKDSGDDVAWQQAVLAGKELDPNNPLYGAVGTIEDADSATMQTAVLDAPLDVEIEAPQVEEVAALDFDLDAPTAAPEDNILQNVADGVENQQVESMDFDITAAEDSSAPAVEGQNSEEVELPDLNDLIFDVTSAPNQEPETASSDEMVPADDGGMEFSVPESEPVEELPAETEQPLAFDLGGIDLNLEQEQEIVTPAESSSESDEATQEEAGIKLDLAKAYLHMGDVSGAREILEEVLVEGDAQQREEAQASLNQLD